MGRTAAETLLIRDQEVVLHARLLARMSSLEMAVFHPVRMG